MQLTAIRSGLQSAMKVNSRGYALAVLIAGAFSARAADATPSRLLGIVCIENQKRALLELREETPSGPIATRKPILAEGERDGAFVVTSIDEKTATVSMRHGIESLVLRLEQVPGEELANRTLHLKSAGLRQVLDIYQGLTGRTLISNPRVWPEITVKSGAGLSAAKASELLAKAFSEAGIAVKLSGTSFAFVVEADRAHHLSAVPEPPPSLSKLRIREQELLSKVGFDKFAQEIIPRGLIKFDDADVLQVLDIYQDLAGLTVLRPEQWPRGKITVKTETDLTRQQSVWLLDALLFVQGGLLMTTQSQKFVYAVPRDTKKALPAATQMKPATSAKVMPARTMRFSNANVGQMARLYAELSGREALPDAHHVFAATFSMNNQQDLSPEEAMFALEAVAALNNLKFQPVGNDKFELIPAAAAQTPAR